MVDTKEIDFGNNELIENEKTIITYSGSLFKNGSKEVYIVYGFGSNWDNTTETKMQSTGNGFYSEITLSGSDILNFCFRNSNYEWDNNCGNDYSATILPPLPFTSDSIECASNTQTEIQNNHIQEYNMDTILDEILESITTSASSENSENFEFISTPETSFASIDNELNEELSSLYTENQSTEEAFSKVLCDLRELNKILDHKAALEYSENITTQVEDTTSTVLTPEFISKINLSTEINQFIEEKHSISKQPETVKTEDLYSTLTVEAATIKTEEEVAQTTETETVESKQKDIAVTLVEHSELMAQSSFWKKVVSFKKQIKLALYKLSNILPKLFGEKDSD